MTDQMPVRRDLVLRLRLERSRATVGALRLALAQRLSERDEARLWARAATHHIWPDHLTVSAPPYWLLTEPPPRRLARLHAPAAHLDADSERLTEVAAVLIDLHRVLDDLTATPLPSRDAAFHEIWLNVLVVQVRWLLTLLDTE